MRQPPSEKDTRNLFERRFEPFYNSLNPGSRDQLRTIISDVLERDCLKEDLTEMRRRLERVDRILSSSDTVTRLRGQGQIQCRGVAATMNQLYENSKDRPLIARGAAKAEESALDLAKAIGALAG